jgi:hypothetical protein
VVHPLFYYDGKRGLHVEAHTDAFVWDNTRSNRGDPELVLMSLVGPDAAVKALSSVLISRSGPVTVRMGQTRVELKLPPAYDEETFMLLSTKLPCGALHQIVASSTMLNPQPDKISYLLTPQNEDPAQKVYDLVKRLHPVPLIPAWKDWLYAALLDVGKLWPLQGTIPNAMALNVTGDFLDHAIADGVRYGGLRDLWPVEQQQVA